MIEKILAQLDESIRVKESLKKSAPLIEKAARKIIERINAGGKVVLFGNGGSAADAQHMAAELVGKFNIQRKAIPAIALTTNTSILTAIANDLGYELTFSRQVEALVNNQDVVIGISTSGRSKNVIEAILEAKKRGAVTIALTGADGGDLASIADITINVPSTSTPRIQEAHITICHILCDIVESSLYKI